MKVTQISKFSLLLVFTLIINVVITQDHSRNHQHHHDHSHQHNHHHGHDHHHSHSNYNHNHHQHQHSTVSQDNQQHQHHSHPHKHSHQTQIQLQMISDKPRLLQTLKLSPITIFFYGNNTSPEYQQFTQIIPAYNDQFFSKTSFQIQFAYISSQKFKLTRPNPSLSIYRNINNGQWLMYRGIFQKTQMLNWITKNIIDPLKQFSGQQIDSLFVEGKPGFVLLDFGQFYLLKTKIMLQQFCQKFQLYCGKVSHTNKALNMIIQLMRAQKQPGIAKLGYWNPKSQQLEIYTKDVGLITGNYRLIKETQLMQLYSGHESVIPYEAELDVGKVIHPQTQIIEIKNENENSEL